jgi:hypothetical protein
MFEPSNRQTLVLYTILNAHHWHARWGNGREIAKSRGCVLRFHREKNGIVRRPSELCGALHDRQL